MKFLKHISAAAYLVQAEKLHVENNKIKDEDGRERIFHGTNVVNKLEPFVPTILDGPFDAMYSFNEEDIDFLASLGYNTLRLGLMWQGAEPIEGQFNQTYVDQVKRIVEMSAAKGITPLINMHQDVYNRKFCGEGFPDWAMESNFNETKHIAFPWPLADPFEVDEKHYPSIDTCKSIDWPDYHFTQALSSAVGNLYDNHNGLRDKFAKFWGYVAEQFKDSEDIIGYELINEPWAGNIFQNPTLLIPGVADREKLQPMYDQINTEIRKHDEDRLIFFESVTWELTGLGEKLGFTHPPGGPEFANKSVLSFHNSVKPSKSPQPYYWDKKIKEMERLGIAAAVTETNGDQEAGLKMTLADQYGTTWMHWAYKKFADWTGDSKGIWNYPCNSTKLEDCLNFDLTKLYARTYPRAVAGDTVEFVFNATTYNSSLEFKPKQSCKLPTVIFASTKWIYTSGFEIEVSGDLALKYVTVTNHVADVIEVLVDPGFFEDEHYSVETTVKIDIFPKKEFTEDVIIQ